ncbi:dnaJ homolog subfamily C member 10-like [Macrosteles quadrilineatus]|uniref:dnaJ homolog subfamily C member 10-like n=1 Tax=Macrosteles quadrilineatus TaxID=74068 RepID=UPI0023E0F997|nr:dnaJ homolog subfamily C member 10-like [Macrosteles quadrilineatus]
MLVTQLLVLLCISLSSGTDYYELLGITKDADNKEIRKAFKKLAVTLHPDKNLDDPDANEKFAKVTRAYEVLKDPSQRKQYDLHGEETPSSWSQSQYHSYSYYRDHFGIYDDDPQIVTLNMADFDSLVTKSGVQWFVNYYSPLCSHCHDLAPEWRKLALDLEGVVMFGAVNCEEDWALCRQQNIRSYPSLIMYPSNERYAGSRYKEPLTRFVLDRAKTEVHEIKSADNWATLTGEPGRHSWVLLLCNGQSLPDCLADDERTRLAAALNGVVGVATVECLLVPICPQLVQGEYTSTVFWRKSPDGDSFATRIVMSDNPRDMVKEVFTYLPDLQQLDPEKFHDIITQLELGSRTSWLVDFSVGADNELDLEIRKLPSMLSDMRVGRVNCARHRQLCEDYSISRYPSFAVFKPGGGYEFFHGTPSAISVSQFARESASATNLRTLSQQLFPQLVTQAQDGDSAWFIDFYAPWCPPCLRLLPELRKASQHFSPVVRFGTVDCTIHAALCRQHNVQSYPTTMLFNQSRPSQTFRGEHSASSIIDFIQDVINPRVIKLTEETFYTSVGRKTPDSVWLVDFFMPWCGPCQQLGPQWRKLAKMVSDMANVFVGEVNCEEETDLCRQQGVHSYPTIRLYPTGSTGFNTVAMYSGYHRDAKSIRQWLFNFLPSAVVELTSESFQEVVEGSDPWLVDFYAPWCGHCHAFAPEFTTVAKKLEGRVKCGKVNCDSHYQVCQRAGVSAYPTVQFYQPQSHSARGVEITTQQADKIISFVEERLRPSQTHDEL